MKNKNDKAGIIISIIVTAIALSTVLSIGAIQDGSIQSQGQNLIERTSEEIQTVPEIVQNTASNTYNQAKEVVEEIPKVAEKIVEETETAEELVQNTAEEVKEAIPEVPIIVQQSKGKLLELISIPPGTGTPGCEDTNSCYMPTNTKLATGGEVIWTNNDDVPHTVTSGNAKEGPDGLFDSGLMMPGETFSVKLDLQFDYDYFCIVHPWMEGKVVIK